MDRRTGAHSPESRTESTHLIESDNWHFRLTDILHPGSAADVLAVRLRELYGEEQELLVVHFTVINTAHWTEITSDHWHRLLYCRCKNLNYISGLPNFSGLRASSLLDPNKFSVLSQTNFVLSWTKVLYVCMNEWASKRASPHGSEKGVRLWALLCSKDGWWFPSNSRFERAKLAPKSSPVL